MIIAVMTEERDLAVLYFSQITNHANMIIYIRSWAANSSADEALVFVAALWHIKFQMCKSPGLARAGGNFHFSFGPSVMF